MFGSGVGRQPQGSQQGRQAGRLGLRKVCAGQARGRGGSEEWGHPVPLADGTPCAAARARRARPAHAPPLPTEPRRLAADAARLWSLVAAVLPAPATAGSARHRRQRAAGGGAVSIRLCTRLCALCCVHQAVCVRQCAARGRHRVVLNAGCGAARLGVERLAHYLVLPSCAGELVILPCMLAGPGAGVPCSRRGVPATSQPAPSSRPARTWRMLSAAAPRLRRRPRPPRRHRRPRLPPPSKASLGRLRRRGPSRRCPPPSRWAGPRPVAIEGSGLQCLPTWWARRYRIAPSWCLQAPPPAIPAPAPEPEAAPVAPPPSPEAAPAAPSPPPLPSPPRAPAPEAEPTPTVQLVSPPAPGAPPATPIPAAEPTPSSTAALQAALTLPAPTEAAPEVVDTRPPRPPGVGPSVTPALVAFSPTPGLPTLPALPPAPGPATRQQVAAAAALDPASCLTLGDILARIPEASNWTQLMRASGPAGCPAAAPGCLLLPACWRGSPAGWQLALHASGLLLPTALCESLAC